MFYNTTNLTGDELKAAQAKTETQEDKVLAYLKGVYPSGRTAYDVQDDVLIDSPRSSAIRALCNLRDLFLIEKTGAKVMERHGSKNHLWRAIP
jgi:hypothetical protein